MPTVNFEGLADVIKQLRPDFGIGSQNQPPAPAAAPAIAVRRPLPPKLSLADFCARFQLSDAIHDKLANIKVTGPHVLRLVNDDALRAEGNLDIGELADLRDVEERWMVEVSLGG